jgi:hypothetical protein
MRIKRWGRGACIVVAFASLIAVLAMAYEFTCTQAACEGGCYCYGNVGGGSSGPCCGWCDGEYWYGPIHVACCLQECGPPKV